MTLPEFQAFPKITRFLEQDVIVTEKIDGTNGIIHIDDTGKVLTAGSRNKWVTVGDDNYGFAQWCVKNYEELLKLGPGYHYGEWWGNGIQRGYRMDKKVFSLFNTTRWALPENRPACCDVVPVIYNGPLTNDLLNTLREPLSFSHAALAYNVNFKNPEGYVVFFSKSYDVFKIPHSK